MGKSTTKACPPRGDEAEAEAEAILGNLIELHVY